MQTIAPTLSTLVLGEAAVHGRLAVFPLTGADAPGPDYLTLDEALAAKTLRITEVSAAGSVPELKAVNSGERPVLLLDGEQLVGAKQNRIVNASFLIPPESVTRIPVSCVEQGRWGYKGREFGASKHFSPHRIRRDNAEFHKTTLRQNRGYATEQGKVWAHVADMSHKMAAPTMTGAMNDILEQREGSALRGRSDPLLRVREINGRKQGGGP